MTKLLEQAIAAVAALPDSKQDAAAEFLLAFANSNRPRLQINESQLAEVELAKREVREGQLATDAEMTEVWRRFGC
jgi:hypothetical protein